MSFVAIRICKKTHTACCEVLWAVTPSTHIDTDVSGESISSIFRVENMRTSPHGVSTQQSKADEMCVLIAVSKQQLKAYCVLCTNTGMYAAVAPSIVLCVIKRVSYFEGRKSPEVFENKILKKLSGCNNKG